MGRRRRFKKLADLYLVTLPGSGRDVFSVSVVAAAGAAREIISDVPPASAEAVWRRKGRVTRLTSKGRWYVYYGEFKPIPLVVRNGGI